MSRAPGLARSVATKELSSERQIAPASGENRCQMGLPRRPQIPLLEMGLRDRVVRVNSMPAERLTKVGGKRHLEELVERGRLAHQKVARRRGLSTGVPYQGWAFENAQSAGDRKPNRQVGALEVVRHPGEKLRPEG